MANKKDNGDFISFLSGVTENMSKYTSEKEMFNGIMPSKIRLAKDGHGARVNARIDSALKGQEFDEADTPPEEKSTIEQDMENELVNRFVEDIFGE